MKRHPILIPISREHHQVLLLAQLLKKDAPPYRGLPDTLEGKILYAVKQYDALLQTHLLRDTQVLYPFLSKWAALQALVIDLESQANRLNTRFENLSSTAQIHELDEMGHDLERYVRTKERELFEKTQQLISENDMQTLHGRLEKN
jgi:hemerythrin-like domain-containing protein